MAKHRKFLNQLDVLASYDHQIYAIFLRFQWHLVSVIPCCDLRLNGPFFDTSKERLFVLQFIWSKDYSDLSWPYLVISFPIPRAKPCISSNTMSFRELRSHGLIHITDTERLWFKCDASMNMDNGRVYNAMIFKLDLKTSTRTSPMQCFLFQAFRRRVDEK